MCIHRDTTDADLCQRRELVRGSAIYVDAAPVRAALHGRLLILEGLEHAERNVLPALNNLLENRELTLPNKTLVPVSAYERLRASGEGSRRFVATHPDFRVIAIGLPCPPNPGRPLDPPLRCVWSASSPVHTCAHRQAPPPPRPYSSRFQGRVVAPTDFAAQVVAAAPGVSPQVLANIAAFAEVLHTMASGAEASGSRIPHFPSGWGRGSCSRRRAVCFGAGAGRGRGVSANGHVCAQGAVCDRAAGCTLSPRARRGPAPPRVPLAHHAAVQCRGLASFGVPLARARAWRGSRVLVGALPDGRAHCAPRWLDSGSTRPRRR